MFSSALKVASLRRPHGDKSARQALAEIVVGVAFEIERDARREPCAEALPGRTLEMDLNRVGRQAVLAVAPRDFGGEHRADGAIDVANRQMHFDRLAYVRAHRSHSSISWLIERLLEPVVLLLDAMQRPIGRNVGLVQDRAEIDVARLPVLDRLVGVETFDVPDHLVDGAEAQLRHVFAQLLGDEHHEVDDVLGLALELLAQLRDPASRCRPGRC